MTARLPIPGQDNGIWGEVLNEFLSASHASDGSLKDTVLAGKANTTHTHSASQISDSTATGRSVIMASDAAAARTAIGAGTSSLILGTTSMTAKAGDYTPSSATDTALGVVELATIAEATTGTDTARAVTPAGLKAVADGKAGLTEAETISGTWDFITPPTVNGATVNSGDQTSLVAGTGIKITSGTGTLTIAADAQVLTTVISSTAPLPNPVTINNSTTATDLFNFPLNGGKWTPGDMLEISAQGYILNNTGSSVNATVRVIIGGTTLAAAGQGIAANVRNKPWVARLVLTVTNTSTIDVSFDMKIIGPSSTDLIVTSTTPTVWLASTTVSESLSTTKNVRMSLQLGTANTLAEFSLSSAVAVRHAAAA